MHAIVPFPHNDHPRIYDHLITILITMIVWEGNIRIDQFLDKKFPWETSAGKRILLQVPTTLLYSIVGIMIPMFFYDAFICRIPMLKRETIAMSSVIIGLMVTLIIMSAEIGIQFFKKWKRSLLEIEEYKAQSLQAQLQNLKNQVNPHFLFNNLSVLSSLVYKDQDKAADFIQQLSKVYRYLLDNNNNELVTLEDEMKFIESYNYLLQIRFDKNLIVDTHIQKEELQKMLPPISLQLLMENAIKHNEVSSEWPLKIDIFTQDDVLVVKNNLQTRTNQEPTSKTGLKNIQQRYAHFTKREVEVIVTESEFTVKLPLIKLS